MASSPDVIVVGAGLIGCAVTHTLARQGASVLMLDAGTSAFKAARSRNLDALAAVNDALYESCVSCHRHYRPNYGRGGGRP